eukprot:39417-Hanusia_phi.AAC.1
MPRPARRRPVGASSIQCQRTENRDKFRASASILPNQNHCADDVVPISQQILVMIAFLIVDDLNNHVQRNTLPQQYARRLCRRKEAVAFASYALYPLRILRWS